MPKFYCNFFIGCSPNPCLNGGDCESTDSDFSCTCKNDYSGDRCEIPPPVTPCSIDSIEKTDSAGAVFIYTRIV